MKQLTNRLVTWMWFKNIQLFQFEETIDYQPELLAEQLEAFAFKPCMKSMPSSVGWISPTDEFVGPLVYAANGVLLLCLKTEEKVIPTSMVQEELTQRVRELEKKESRSVGRREKLNLKDDVYAGLLTQALSKTGRIYAMIDTVNKWLVVDASSPSKADFFTSFLRKSLGSLKITLPEVINPSMLMTQWLTGRDNPSFLELDESCVLQDVKEERRIIRIQRHDLFSENVTSFLDEGFMVQQLGLKWSSQLAFTLKNDFSINRVRFLETLQEKASEIYSATDEERFDSDFAIMSETFRAFLQELLQIFEKSPDDQSVKERRVQQAEPQVLVSA